MTSRFAWRQAVWSVPLAAFAALSSTGCTRWRTQDVTPRELLSARKPEQLRITRLDHSRVVFRRPQLVGDTIYDGRLHRDERAQVPVSGVSEIAIRGWDPLGTIALTLGTAALGAVVAVGAVWSSRAD
jgi:hypothetical protein